MQISDLLAAIEGGKWPFRPAFGAGYEADIQGMSVQHYQLANSAYCGSLDAARTLHEAVLPGWSYLVGMKNVALSPPPREAVLGRVGSAETPARAWLIAILKALIATEDN